MLSGHRLAIAEHCTSMCDASVSHLLKLEGASSCSCIWQLCAALQFSLRVSAHIQPHALNADLLLCIVQLPFRAAKYEVDVNEPGLGKISGCHISIRAEVLLGPAFLLLLSSLKDPPVQDEGRAPQKSCMNLLSIVQPLYNMQQ